MLLPAEPFLLANVCISAVYSAIQGLYDYNQSGMSYGIVKQK